MALPLYFTVLHCTADLTSLWSAESYCPPLKSLNIYYHVKSQTFHEEFTILEIRFMPLEPRGFFTHWPGWSWSSWRCPWAWYGWQSKRLVERHLPVQLLLLCDQAVDQGQGGESNPALRLLLHLHRGPRFWWCSMNRQKELIWYMEIIIWAIFTSLQLSSSHWSTWGFQVLSLVLHFVWTLLELELIAFTLLTLHQCSICNIPIEATNMSSWKTYP